MPDAAVRFERERVDGLVAIGTPLIDAAKRLGVRFEVECDAGEPLHYCSVVVARGASSLSPLTQIETEHFAICGRRSNERLACETKITKSGEIVIMTDEKKEGPKKAETPKDRFEAEFEALPLDKKFARLLKMEAATISEAFSYAVNSPMKVVEKVGDAISELGIKLESEIRKASQPKSADACSDPTEPAAKAAAPKEPAAKPKARTTKKSPPPKPKS